MFTEGSVKESFEFKEYLEGENKNYLQRGFQCEFPQLTASVSLENLLEVQILFPTTDLLNQKFCVDTSLPGDSYIHLRMRTTALN